MSDTLKRIEHNPRQTHSLVLFDLHLICVRSKADTTISHQRKWHRFGSLLTAIRFAIVGTSDKSTGSLWGVFKMVWLRLPMKSPHQCCTIVQVALCHQCNVNKPFDIKPLWLHCSSDLCSSVMVSFFFIIILWQTVRWVVKLLLSMLHFLHRRHGRMITL